MISKKARGEKKIIELLDQIELLCSKYPHLWNLVGWEVFLRKGGEDEGEKRIKVYIDFFKPYLNRLKKGMRVLDLGCGRGEFTHYIKNSGLNVDPVDISPSALKRVHSRNKKIMSAENLSELKSGIYDAVFAIELLNYVSSPERVLKEIKRVLKRDGFLFISVENKYGGILSSSILRIGDVLKAIKDDYACVEWEMATRYYTKSDFKKLLKKEGFEILKLSGLHYVWDGVFQHLLSNPHTEEECMELEKISRKEPVLKNLPRAWACAGIKR